MFATQFPDLKWLKEQAERRIFRGRLSDGSLAPPGGWPTVILNVQARNIYRNNIPGPLSLFSNWNGSSQLTTEGQTRHIPSDCFVLTNPGQRYTLEVGNSKAETFNVHFGEQWTSDALASLTQTHDWLADRRECGDPIHFGFHNKVFRKTASASLTLTQLQRHANGDPLRRDELLIQLLRELIKEQQGTAVRTDSIDAIKGSTRREIIRRLHLATDHIYSFPEISHSLDDLARVSMLSKFHFLRAFKDAFGTTPHQFITALRMERAKDLLLKSKLEVAEIGTRVGFDSSSVFSRRFRAATGLYPTQFRARNF
jgi:AraC family transcriptional regulator